MPGYETREIQQVVGRHAYRLRVLRDTQQYDDPDGHGARAGVSPEQWSLFGQLWPAGLRLAEAMDAFDIGGKRILELGCGIGLASLVLKRRGADIVASDVHPLAEVFLAYNAALNDLPAVPFRHVQWHEPMPNLGRFDAIIASDVLYERGQPEVIAAVVERHSLPAAEVLVMDPGRGNSGRFTRLLEAHGFTATTTACAMADGQEGPHRGKLLRYGRGGAPGA